MTRLEDFLVIDKLQVHELEVEPKRVQAMYSVTLPSGEVHSASLIYSYEHPYFNPGKPEDINLATMMTAQVALNYGLFCREIEFDGLFDHPDRQFIQAMMENTSREILTNKLLVKNEFLLPPFINLTAEKRERYTQAKITFSNAHFGRAVPEKKESHPDRNKFAILSSGGKDSLLTYGLVREFGEPFPIFINESGRHWFTAVNAYRYMKEKEPNTSKPWCNSDRVFNWMLKHLLFIRKDYANIRSDMYPVRLWTVAVFLFGTLPIVRKKNIGHVLIGDEYDTTLKHNLGGISHYKGLYDQSKYFDNAMTRYFRQKGWNIYQYSMLRSLSELLIMKILVNRYPELQMHQVSCHAAHEKDGRMHPCGKCEKCRRIIGMISSLGGNPQNCGYTDDQVRLGLKALASKTIKQIGSDAGHLYFLLHGKGLLPYNDFIRKAASPHPEIMKLRFDRERSNLEDLPKEIRKPLFGILRQYADGTVERKAAGWEEIDDLETYLSKINYKYNEK